MTCWISRTVSSNVRSSSLLAVISRYSVSRTVRRSPSSGSLAPFVILIVRMRLRSEAFDGAGLIGVYLNEILSAGHREHRLDPLLDARELERSTGGGRLPVKVHQ